MMSSNTETFFDPLANKKSIFCLENWIKSIVPRGTKSRTFLLSQVDQNDCHMNTASRGKSSRHLKVDQKFARVVGLRS